MALAALCAAGPQPTSIDQAGRECTVDVSTSPVIALGKPELGDPELHAVAQAFASGWVSGDGPTGRLLAGRLAALTGMSGALPLSSCTAALHLAVVGLGAGKGDEVVVADYTFPATGHAVRYAGATPVFADVRADTATVDPAAVEAAITPRTVGIVAVDVFGQCADYDELQHTADRHGLWLVEDAACSIGATYRGRPAGSLGDAGCFSFQGRKIITAGEGGALVTDHHELLARADLLHAFGITGALSRAEEADLPVPVFSELGHNYRLSDIAAAIVVAQLDRLPAIVAARQAVADAYRAALGGIEELTLPVALPDRSHAWQGYVVTLAPQVARGALARHLRSSGVQCNFGTYSSHRQPVYGADAACPVSADLFDRHLALPMHTGLTLDDVERVADTIRGGLARAR